MSQKQTDIVLEQMNYLVEGVIGKVCIAATRCGRPAEALVIPVAALAAALALFGAFVAVLGQNPLEVYALIYRGAFASAFSWQNTLARRRR